MHAFTKYSHSIRRFGALGVTLGLVHCGHPTRELRTPVEVAPAVPEVAADEIGVGETILASLPFASRAADWAGALRMMGPPPAAGGLCGLIMKKGEGSAEPGADDPSLVAMIEEVAGVWESSGTMPEGAAKWYEHFGALTAAKGWAQDYCDCIGTDGDECFAHRVVWPGICYFAAGKLSSMLAPSWAALGLPYEALCNEQPVLKCCKYTGYESGSCHSAFNSESPINCEGAPTGGSTYGICLPTERYPGDPGCRCDYIPACASTVVDSPDGDAWLFNQLTADLADAVPPVLHADPAGFFKFVVFRGAGTSFRAVRDFGPFADGDPDGVYTTNDDYHANDADPQARRYRAFTTLAVSRIVNGIPNIRGRWDIISGKLWTNAEKSAYLASIPNPDAVLRDLVGTIGLKLLKRAEPQRYQLLAVPAAGEPPWPGGQFGGALTGKPPTLALEWVGTRKNIVNIQPTIVDPQAADNHREGLDGYLVFVDWGDGKKQALPVPLGKAQPGKKIRSQTESGFLHTFLPGQYTVRAWVKNTAGLYGAAKLTVRVPGPTVPPRK